MDVKIITQKPTISTRHYFKDSTLTEKLAFIVSSACFTGLIPFAPGTWGTISALLITYFLFPRSILFHSTALVIIFVLGVLCSNIVIKRSGTGDDPKIVIDEFAGFLVSVLFLPHKWPIYILCFLTFRLFDIWKPAPIGYLDRRIKGGLGVMLDDVVAGIFANIVVRFLNFFLVL